MLVTQPALPRVARLRTRSRPRRGGQEACRARDLSKSKISEWASGATASAQNCARPGWCGRRDHRERLRMSERGDRGTNVVRASNANGAAVSEATREVWGDNKAARYLVDWRGEPLSRRAEWGAPLCRPHPKERRDWEYPAERPRV